MASSSNHENSELASRLLSAADGIVNSAAIGLERDLREAARIVNYRGPAVVTTTIPDLVSELHKIANATTDAVTRERLRRLLGEAQQ